MGQYHGWQFIPFPAQRRILGPFLREIEAYLLIQRQSKHLNAKDDEKHESQPIAPDLVRSRNESADDAQDDEKPVEDAEEAHGTR